MSLILVILVLRSAHLAVVVVEHQRCLDHVRERRHLHVGGKGGFVNEDLPSENLPVSRKKIPIYPKPSILWLGRAALHAVKGRCKRG